MQTGIGPFDNNWSGSSQPHILSYFIDKACIIPNAFRFFVRVLRFASPVIKAAIGSGDPSRLSWTTLLRVCSFDCID